MKKDTYHRCPVCKALIRANVSECPACRLIRDTPVSQNEKVWEPRNPLIRFFWGLGIPLDIWILSLLVVIWFVVFAVGEGAGDSALRVLAGLGFPFALILSSEVLSSVRFLGVGLPFDSIDPIAVKIFAWVYVIGAHIWFVYTLVRGET